MVNEMLTTKMITGTNNIANLRLSERYQKTKIKSIPLRIFLKKEGGKDVMCCKCQVWGYLLYNDV